MKEEQLQKKRETALAKARATRKKNLIRKKREAEKQAANDRLSDLERMRQELPGLLKQYDVAWGEANKTDNNWNAKIEASWNKVLMLGNNARNMISAIRRLEKEARQESAKRLRSSAS